MINKQPKGHGRRDLSIATGICSARSGNLLDSGIDLLRVGIPKPSADNRIDDVGKRKEKKGINSGQDLH